MVESKEVDMSQDLHDKMSALKRQEKTMIQQPGGDDEKESPLKTNRDATETDTLVNNKDKDGEVVSASKEVNFSIQTNKLKNRRAERKKNVKSSRI